jgi:hypothetical protein
MGQTTGKIPSGLNLTAPKEIKKSMRQTEHAMNLKQTTQMYLLYKNKSTDLEIRTQLNHLQDQVKKKTPMDVARAQMEQT